METSAAAALFLMLLVVKKEMALEQDGAKVGFTNHNPFYEVKLFFVLLLFRRFFVLLVWGTQY
jgi:hypothetical protein